MATIKSGLNLFVYNGPEADLNTVPWLPNVRGIYQVNSYRDAWDSFKPNRPLPAFEVLTLDTFYLIDAIRDFALPDAQVISCATGEASGLIPEGLSIFVYSGADLDLNTAGFIGSVTAVYQIGATGYNWDSFKPNRPLPAFETLVQGTFYFIQASSPFILPGAQVIGCLDTYGDETVTGSLYVKYTDLLGTVPDIADPKTAPDMVLFKSLLEAFNSHNHDTRYYQQFQTYTKAEVDLFLSGVDEVIELPTFADFPATGLPSKLYLDASTNTGYRWNGSGYSPVSSPGIDLSPYLTKAEAAATYQLKGDYLTAAQANALYALLGSSFTKTESDNRYQLKGNYLTQTAGDNLYQAKGNYAKEISLNGFSYFPDGTGRVTMFYTYDLIAALKALPGYVATTEQTLGHDINGVIRWGEGTAEPPVDINEYVQPGYTSNFYVN